MIGARNDSYELTTEPDQLFINVNPFGYSLVDQDENETVVGHAVKDRSQQDSGVGISYIDTSLVIERDGVIEAWRVYVGNKANQRLQVYRPVSNQRYKLMTSPFVPKEILKELICMHVAKQMNMSKKMITTTTMEKKKKKRKRKKKKKMMMMLMM